MRYAIVAMLFLIGTAHAQIIVRADLEGTVSWTEGDSFGYSVGDSFKGRMVANSRALGLDFSPDYASCSEGFPDCKWEGFNSTGVRGSTLGDNNAREPRDPVDFYIQEVDAGIFRFSMSNTQGCYRLGECPQYIESFGISSDIAFFNPNSPDCYPNCPDSFGQNFVINASDSDRTRMSYGVTTPDGILSVVLSRATVSVPEPGSLSMMLLGLLALGGKFKRRTLNC